MMGGRTLSAALALLLALGAPLAAMAEDVELQVQAPNETEPWLMFGSLALFGGIPPRQQLSDAVALVQAEPADACGPLDDLRGAAALVVRGNCTFTEKYEAVVAAGGSALVLFNNAPGCVSMAGNASAPNATGNATAPPPAISISTADAARLAAATAAATSPLTLRLRLLVLPMVDASAAVLWAMAVCCLVCGSLWAGADHASEAKAAAAGGSGSPGRPNGRPAAAQEAVTITQAGAVSFVLVASAALMAMFLLSSWVVTVMMTSLYALLGAQAAALLLEPAMGAVAPVAAARQLSVPLAGKLSVAQLAAGAGAVAVAGAWVAVRRAWWAWPLHDALGCAILILMLRTLRLQSLRVACVLLPLAFAYDVFWVFLSPLFFGGESVMVDVARGGASCEPLPMLLKVPRFDAPRGLGGYSMLGFGDVALVGVFTAWCRCLDLDWAAADAGAHAAGERAPPRWRSRLGVGGYFWLSVCGYGAGLLLTYVALMLAWGGDQGQPALLYLVPCCLGTVLLVAGVRGELRALFAHRQGLAHALGEGRADESERPGAEASAWARRSGSARRPSPQGDEERAGLLADARV